MTLADEIATFLAGSGRALTAEQIARGIKARTYDVRHTLRSDPRFALCSPERQKPQLREFTLHRSYVPQDGRGRATTHDEKVLSLLADGAPHSHHELYNLGVVAHSRVSSLRRKGHKIACWKEGRHYLYRLEAA